MCSSYWLAGLGCFAVLRLLLQSPAVHALLMLVCVHAHMTEGCTRAEGQRGDRSSMDTELIETGRQAESVSERFSVSSLEGTRTDSADLCSFCPSCSVNRLPSPADEVPMDYIIMDKMTEASVAIDNMQIVQVHSSRLFTSDPADCSF